MPLTLSRALRRTRRSISRIKLIIPEYLNDLYTVNKEYCDSIMEINGDTKIIGAITDEPSQEK